MYKYRLQAKEVVVLPNVLGNHSMPVYTYRWKDVAVGDDRDALEAIMPNGESYRIEVVPYV